MPSSPEKQGRERRHNVVLRDLLDELLQVARHLSNNAPSMSENELTYARERLAGLVDEVWQQATGTREPDA